MTNSQFRLVSVSEACFEAWQRLFPEIAFANTVVTEDDGSIRDHPQKDEIDRRGRRSLDVVKNAISVSTEAGELAHYVSDPKTGAIIRMPGEAIWGCGAEDPLSTGLCQIRNGLYARYRGEPIFFNENDFKDWPEPRLSCSHDRQSNKITPKAKPRAKYSPVKLERWYKEYVAGWRRGEPIPSRNQDLSAAKDYFSADIPRDVIRALRNKIAPEEWTRRGRRRNQNRRK